MVREDAPAEVHQTYRYQKPKGNEQMNEPVSHIMTCAVGPRPLPPPPALPQDPAEFREDCWTIKFVNDMFPESKDEHAMHDLHSKQMEHYDIDEGGVKTPIPVKKLINSEGRLWAHEIHLRNYMETHKAGCFIVYGNEAIKTVAGFFGLKAEWGVYPDIDVGGKLVTIVFLPHPCYMGIWASQDHTRRVVGILEELFVLDILDINISKLQSRIREYVQSPDNAGSAQYPGLSRLVIPRSSLTTLEEKRADRRARYEKEKASRAADPLRYSQYLEQVTKRRKVMQANPEKHAEYLDKQKEYGEGYKNNPVKHAHWLDTREKRDEKRKADPETRAHDLEQHRISSAKSLAKTQADPERNETYVQTWKGNNKKAYAKLKADPKKVKEKREKEKLRRDRKKAAKS